MWMDPFPRRCAEVVVKNKLPLGSNTVVHWHGMLQVLTPFNDGTIGTTQCPIPPGGSMTYGFRVTSAVGDEVKSRVTPLCVIFLSTYCRAGHVLVPWSHARAVRSSRMGGIVDLQIFHCFALLRLTDIRTVFSVC